MDWFCILENAIFKRPAYLLPHNPTKKRRPRNGGTGARAVGTWTRPNPARQRGDAARTESCPTPSPRAAILTPRRRAGCFSIAAAHRITQTRFLRAFWRNFGCPFSRDFGHHFWRFFGISFGPGGEPFLGPAANYFLAGDELLGDNFWIFCSALHCVILLKCHNFPDHHFWTFRRTTS